MTTDDKEIGQVGSYKYLGTHLENLLQLNAHRCFMFLISPKTAFSLLNKVFGMSTRVMTTFIILMVLESLIRCVTTARFGSLSQVQVEVRKTAMKIIGIKNPTLLSVFKGNHGKSGTFKTLHMFCTHNVNYCSQVEDIDQADTKVTPTSSLSPSTS